MIKKESDIVKQKSDKQPDTTSISDLGSEESDKQPDTIGIPDLESEESAEQRINQQGQGLKILTPSPMLSRLRISLAQLKAGIILKNLKMKLGNNCILCTD